MKKIKRKYMVATAILIFTVACAGTGAAYAAEAEKTDSMSGLVSAIAQKFGINEAEVWAVVDAEKSKMEIARKERMAQMENKRQTQFESRLGDLVTAGKLTQAQADLIKGKNAELEAAREAQMTVKESLKDKTQAERQAAMAEQKIKMEAGRTALKQWASANGIPKEYVPMAGGMGGGHGRGGRGFGGDAPCMGSDSIAPVAN